MKKLFLVATMFALTISLSAQKNMHVWVAGVSSDFAISDVDSVTFTDDTPAPDPVPVELTGKFSVSATKQVTFAPGNLQCAKDGEGNYTVWTFAATQYEMLGTANVSGSALADKIDLFGWSSDNALTPFGISSSANYADYEGIFVDWGSNVISGVAANTYRTLSDAEWSYIIYTRPNAIDLYGLATVAGVAGLVVLPDDWVLPFGITFTAGDAAFNQNVYTAAEWTVLEEAGAIFLPATGERDGVNVTLVGEYGGYWSSEGDGSAMFLSFMVEYVDPANNNNCNYGYGVRLAKDVPGAPEPEVSKFSVADDTQVTFAPGNLQCAKDGEGNYTVWSFAATQYETLGAANISGTALADKIDLFGWSGNGTAVAYGIGVSTTESDYNGVFVDWGTNVIGSDPANTWSTLSKDEWTYLFNTRTNAAELCGAATVEGVQGLVVLPDAWTLPAGATFVAGAPAVYTQNVYTAAEWTVLEDAGAVFLPVTGIRNGLNINYYPDGGYYATSSKNLVRELGGEMVERSVVSLFTETALNATKSYAFAYGKAVRLVKRL